MKKISVLISLLFLAIPSLSHAWWDEGWSYRKKLTIDTAKTGAGEAINEVPVLVRLHAGNFSYFLDVKPDGSDLRFVAKDDKTPLKFHIEKFDQVNEIALIWVNMPNIASAAAPESFWMYYGNSAAVSAADIASTFDVNQVATYHFMEGATFLHDSTAYANHIEYSRAEALPTSLIGSGIKLDGTSSIRLANKINLSINVQTGYSFSTWIRTPGIQNDAVIFWSGTEQDHVVLGHDASGLYVKVINSGQVISDVRGQALVANTWQHVAMVIGNNRLILYVDGQEVAAADALIAPVNAVQMIGSSPSANGFLIADLDEISISNLARTPGWIALRAKNEAVLSNILVYGQDESSENASSGSESSYFGVIMKNVTVDGWVVIVILFVMMIISWILMAMKAMFLRRIGKDNDAFKQDYIRLGSGDPSKLDQADDNNELHGSPVAEAFFGKHDHYQSSTLYSIYHRGIQEVQARVGKAVGAQTSMNLSNQSLEAIRAGLDATMVRESQKINKLMVLLTIAISGGPFLGLLGTVVGVMITFAAIAASGDVNVNAIAPGIAAALLATVAGLAVAIPALFGYNYLGAQIKDMNADMRVFIDEFITRVGEYYSGR